jgi:hypothetical protein
MKNDFSEIQKTIEKLDIQIQERKKEYLSLKVLLYAGIFLLLIGGIYSNSTLQQVQLTSLEKSFSNFQNKLNQDIGNIEVALYNSLQQQGYELKKLIIQDQRHKEILNKRALFENLKKSFLKAEKDLKKINNLDPQTQKAIKNFQKSTLSILKFYDQTLQSLPKKKLKESSKKK